MTHRREMTAEKLRIARQMETDGFSTGEIAARLDLSPDMVRRYLSGQLKLPMTADERLKISEKYRTEDLA